MACMPSCNFSLWPAPSPGMLVLAAQHHNLPLVLWLIDTSRPFPPDPAKVWKGLQPAA
jgi:hypothetical protein